ncbi:MAG: hypothetical protein WCG75_11370, partial [Armatimonadota bacterium]
MFLAPAAVFLAFLQTPEIDTDIYFSGALAGTNHFSAKADKSFDSVSTIKLQGFDINSHLTLNADNGT